MTTGLSGVPCLVLGAGGFIGTNLCLALAAAGAPVRGFGHAPAFPTALPPMPWTLAGMDDLPALARALRGVEVVFHLLGGSVPAAAERDAVDDLRRNAAGAIEVFRLCREAGVRRLVFLSSGGTVYGIPRTLPITEDHPTDPVSVYGIHKLLAEKHLGLEARRQGLQAVVLRAANPYGPYQRPDRGQGVVASLIARRQAGLPVEIWGDGRVVRDFLHVRDLADAMLAAARADAPARVMNVGSGIGRSLLDVVRDVDAVLGLRDAPVVHRPARAADVPVNVLDIALIGRELGWAPRIDWLDGLRGTAAWLADRQPVAVGA